MANWSPERQQAVQARCDKATKGPWHSPGFNEVHTDHDRGVFVGKDDFGDDDCVVADYCTDDNADFIAHARQDLPDALAELAAKDAEIARLKLELSSARDQFDRHVEWTADEADRDGRDALISRQQADLTRLAEVGKQVAADLAIFMGEIPPGAKFSMEAVAAWYRIRGVIERSEDAKEAARE